MSEENFSKHITDRCNEFVKEMAEYCDSIRVVVTFDKGHTLTSHFSVGRGNIYAQMGSIREWLLIQEEITRAETRKDFNETSE